MGTGKRPLQAYVEEYVEEDEEDSDSDVPLRETQAKRLKRFHEPKSPRTISSSPPLQPSQPAPTAQIQPATQPSVTAIRNERTQCHARRPRPRAPIPSIRTQLPATAVINNARQASRSFVAVSELFGPAATPTTNTLPIDGIDLNPPQPRWPPLPDDNIPHAFLFYAEEIRIVVNMLCGTCIDRELFFELIRHQDTTPSARPVWTIPEISEQKEIGFLCAKASAALLRERTLATYECESKERICELVKAYHVTCNGEAKQLIIFSVAWVPQEQEPSEQLGATCSFACHLRRSVLVLGGFTELGYGFCVSESLGTFEIRIRSYPLGQFDSILLGLAFEVSN
ncbi:uncharacterized protein LW93_7032 [Fusarium fujikuroi]|nr:uncharacterized protein LW93_7032 [Fusarium fujikuroi]